MEHLEWHNHAFIDESNKVIDVAVFQESDHDTDILETIRESLGAKQTVCCCTFGMASVGYDWIGTEFRPPAPYPSWVWNVENKGWEAPIDKPIDGGMYIWNEPTKNWLEITPPDEPVPNE